VLDGRADEELLDTYNTERQPVGAFTTEQAYTRYVLRLDQSLGKDNLMPIVDEAAVELGYRYRSPGIDVEAGDDALWEDPRSPSGRPGFRAPHATVVANGAECSTLDLFGRDFVVVAGSAGEAWCDAARAAGEVLGVGVDTYRVGAEIAGAELEELFGTGADGASLVRPDGFVAWRTPAPADDTDDVLTRAIGAALGRSRVSV
jgi:hypothetical protein